MNKLVAIISLSVVGVLLASVILMALIPINFNLKVQNEPDIIKIYSSGNQVKAVSKVGSAADKEIYNKILEIYNDAGSHSTLNSLFLGLWGKGVSAGFGDAKSLTSLYPSGTYCIEFWYNKSQKMIDGDGSQYVWQDNGKQSYTRLFIPVKNSSDVEQLTYYVTESEQVSPSPRLTYTCYGSQAKLFRYLNSLTYIAG